MTASALHLPVGLPPAARFAKRTIDIIVGLVFLVPLTVLLVVNGCYYLRHGGGSPLVSEPRVGKSGPFPFYKLRVQTRDGRATRLGEFLRHWGIDEIAQVLNFLRGEMSLVGPRPTTPEIHAGYAATVPNYQVRYCVRPGLLGLAVGSVTNRMCMEEGVADSGLRRLPYDLMYVERWTWRLEFQAIRVSLADMLRGHDPT